MAKTIQLQKTKTKPKEKFKLPNDPVTQYVNDVLTGKILAGKLIKQTCERHIRDLKRQGTKGFPFVFKIEKAERFWNFSKLLKYTDGPPEQIGQYIDLAPFQKFITGSIFGWVYKETGYRRYRKAYIQLGRKNGKSILMAIIAIYMLYADNWYGAQVYATATERKQARIVWGEALKMIVACPQLKKRFKIRESRWEIEYKPKNGIFIPLSRDTGSIDGFNPHCGVVDEYWRHKTNQVVKTLDDGTVQQTESLIFIITTAGPNLRCPCHEEYIYCGKVLERSLDNEEYFIYIAQLDKKDKRFDYKNWIKANPLVCSTAKGLNNLKRLAREADGKGEEEKRDFMTKSLNDWVDFKAAGYMPSSKWQACGVDILPDLKGRECYVGYDLSAKIALTSVAFEFPIEIDGEIKYIGFTHSFIPEETLEEKRKVSKVPFDFWADQGWITITPGAVVDYRFVKKYVLDKAAENDWFINLHCLDPWGAQQISNDLIDEGETPAEIIQGIKTLSEPTKDLRDMVYAKRFIHNNDPVLVYAMSNAVTRMDHNKNFMLDKEKSYDFIDPAAALMNAHTRAMLGSQDEEAEIII